ncbi:antiviral innate immune response receptor RIG-I-like [Ptychodera flava]|uniref:antiviral innate immune response receptor RIG-I-like n=1 Tax=Ptychodera flava TaxID=63121 RepID=UPI00396A06A3
MYEENPDSRTIVITKTRASCYALTRWMEQTGGLSDLKPAFLVGSKSSSDGSKGMAQAEQSDVLDRFQDGTHRIIVCTSVGQEGIDIKKCNLVLRYNYSNNEIGRIQAKGRNRTMGGKTVLLAGHHTRIIKQEEMNIIRELMMYKAIDEIRGMPQDEYVSSIKKMQENDQIDRLQQAEAEKTAKMLREKEGRGVSIKFLCGKCSAFACLATDFRALKTNYVVTNTAFLDRIKTQPHAKPKQIDDLFYKEGKVFCKECMHDWGIMVKRKGSHYPMLKIRSFILERGGSRSIYRNWRDAPFVAEPLDDACLLK